MNIKQHKRTILKTILTILTILTEVTELTELTDQLQVKLYLESELHYSSNKPYYEHNSSLTVVVYGTPKTGGLYYSYPHSHL